MEEHHSCDNPWLKGEAKKEEDFNSNIFSMTS